MFNSDKCYCSLTIEKMFWCATFQLLSKIIIINNNVNGWTLNIVILFLVKNKLKQKPPKDNFLFQYWL